jgi:F-type H+-transporting ATPase subunit b
MGQRIRNSVLAAGLLFACGVLFAQPGSIAQPGAVAQPSSNVPPPQLPPGEVGTRATPLPTAEAREAQAEPENAAEEEENAQFKYSSIVRGVAAKTGLSKETVYWIFNVINFAILFGAAVWIMRKVMPNGFAPRTAEIQKGIEEARKASADAAARLGEIESRLGRLDGEIAALRSAAENDFSGEEQRIKADAERDAMHIKASAEQEIAAAARSAQRELKAFAAGLAVDLAEKKIKVDEATDQALVRSFATQLLPQRANYGLDGGAGKDGQ